MLKEIMEPQSPFHDGVLKYSSTVGREETNQAVLNIIGASGFHTDKLFTQITDGGSAAMASHVAVDMTKNAGIRSVTFNEYDLITTLANDYGYENWVAKAIEFYHDPNDLVLLISASGQSVNILNAATISKELSLPVITFSGMSPQNPLRNKGEINLWVDSMIYNIVEMTHHIWLLAIVDMIISNTD